MSGDRRPLRVGVDASNLRGGGGLTHLKELFGAANPCEAGIGEVVIWGSEETLQWVPERPWLRKVAVPELSRGLGRRAWWQHRTLPTLARAEACDVLFAPGSAASRGFRPVVTMSRNMLPFEWRELRRFGISIVALRLLILRFAQSRTFRHADGVIFLTRYAKETVLRVIGGRHGATTTIPHGVDQRFFHPPRRHRSGEPLRLIYVSVVDPYKHQEKVAEAVVALRDEGYAISLELIGPGGSSLSALTRRLTELDPQGKTVRFLGPIPHDDLDRKYAAADICVFASSCENMPNILLEGMAAGLPIACADRGPMPEILGDAGVYFDPENSASIADAIRRLLDSAELREELARRSYARASTYSWNRCASETMKFLADRCEPCAG